MLSGTKKGRFYSALAAELEKPSLGARREKVY
jgi:hypothetical protein